MSILRRALALIRENRGAFVAINAIYWGLVIAGAIFSLIYPSLQQQLLEAVGVAFGAQGPLAMVGGAYSNGQILAAVGLTFVVNLFLGTLIQITLPSLIIPFSGMLLGVYRAVLWGILFAPVGEMTAGMIFPHYLTILLEGEGYVLALFAVYLQARAFIWPKTAGVTGHGRGYVEGLKRTAILYVPVVLVLLVAAVYEALEVILIIPRLVH